MISSQVTYTDAQVTQAAGLHLDNLRKLITWGAVQPVQAGGGRGRVRKWTTRQALRISVTAQFVEAGFSLQMAHTLTYCLPLDDLLYAYDPAVLAQATVNAKDDKRLLSLLTGPNEPSEWPNRDYLGSQTVLVDGKYLYSDVLGDAPTLMAVVDLQRQRVVPTFGHPYQFLHGSGMVAEHGLPPSVDARQINRESLLIDDAYLVKRKAWKRPPESVWPAAVDGQLISLEDVVCRSLLIINLALGLVTCVRTLNGLPVPYQPYEPNNDH